MLVTAIVNSPITCEQRYDQLWMSFNFEGENCSLQLPQFIPRTIEDVEAVSSFKTQ
jgi:hypothetical protein